MSTLQLVTARSQIRPPIRKNRGHTISLMPCNASCVVELPSAPLIENPNPPTIAIQSIHATRILRAIFLSETVCGEGILAGCAATMHRSGTAFIPLSA